MPMELLDHPLLEPLPEPTPRIATVFYDVDAAAEEALAPRPADKRTDYPPYVSRYPSYHFDERRPRLSAEEFAALSFDDKVTYHELTSGYGPRPESVRAADTELGNAVEAVELIARSAYDIADMRTAAMRIVSAVDAKRSAWDDHYTAELARMRAAPSTKQPGRGASETERL